MSLDADLRVIKNNYKALLEKVSMYDMERNPDEIILKLTQMIDVVKDFKEERKNIDAIVVEG